jgi:iron complex outermembrane recepter protein
LEATLGDRVFRITNNNITTYSGVYNGGTTTVPGRIQEHGTTPKIGLSYHLTPNAMLYTSASKGFRPGGSVSLPQAICAADLRAIGLNTVPTSYTDDDLWNYELGEKFISEPLRLSVNSSVFYIKWTGLQQSVELPTCGYDFTGNFGSAVSKGADLEIHYDITRALRIAFAGSFTQAQLTSTVAGTQGQVGDTLENVPRWMIDGSVEYHAALGHELSGFARLDMSTTTHQYNNFDSTSIYYGTGGYSLANVRFGISNDKWQGSFFISNLLNKHAETALPVAFGIDLPITRAVSLNRPRTIGFDFRRDF